MKLIEMYIFLCLADVLQGTKYINMYWVFVTSNKNKVEPHIGIDSMINTFYNDTIYLILALCQPLQVQNDVILVTSTDGKTTQTSFNCLSGYALHGEQVSSCRGDGTWDNVAPICGMNLLH